MANPIILYEIAKRHQRDLDKEIALRQIVKQVKAAKPGLRKCVIIANKSLLKKLSAWLIRETLSPEGYQALNTKA